jgi:DNA-binding NarL/FixJ family response regulator
MITRWCARGFVPWWSARGSTWWPRRPTVEALDLAIQHRPDVAILDISMPLLNGLDAAREIGRACPGTRAILLTQHAEERYILAALKAGVHGYVLKSQAITDVVQAIRDAVRGRLYISPTLSQVIVGSFRAHAGFPDDPLTLREREVLQLIAEGRSSKEVARILKISVKTAESHRSRLMSKLDLHEIAGLVRYAVRHGLVLP